jgi:hypothetical protein
MVVVLFAILYVFVRGTFGNGARDIDTRYFFIAGKVWVHGQSPYDFASYLGTWKQYFSDEIAPGAFAYLPGSFLYAAPLGLLDWQAARVLFRAMNLGAVLLIATLCLLYARSWRDGKPSLRHYAWTAVGLTLGGMPGTILTGQSTVIVCAATLAVAISPFRRWYSLLPAIVVAGSKPQIAAPALIVMALVDRPARRQILGAAIAATFICGLIMVFDTAPITHLLHTVWGNAHLGANTSTRMIGLGPLLAVLGVNKIVGGLLQLLALTSVVGVVLLWAPRTTTPGCQGYRIIPHRGKRSGLA